MALNTQSFQQIVSQMATAMQAAVSALSNFNPGTVLRALIEAVAAQIMNLQNLIVQMYSIARASTSNGPDLDSWMADFGLIRLPAVAATGQVTFARFTPTQAVTILVGTLVESSDGTVIFAVIADTNNVNYSASAGGYPMASNQVSVSVTVQCQSVNGVSPGGTGGNVAIGTLNTLTTPIVGVDYVTNAAAFSNGKNAETDAAFRLRFQNFIASLGEGTLTAIGTAITSVQSGLTYTLTEDLDYNGATDYGYFYAVVDDGSGNPPSSLLNNITAAINAVRSCGIRFGVFGPVVVNATVSATITTAAGYTHSAVVASVTTAVQNFINTLGVGVTLPYLQLSAVIFAVPGVINVSGLSLNSGTSDIVPTAKQVVKVLSVTIT